MWKEILFSVLNGDLNIPSPYHKDGIINSIFVIVDDATKMGFLWMWCSITHNGINISRMKIPENVKSINSEDLESLKIPPIHFVDPAENGGGL
jgi:hypothetical protein